MTPTVTATAMLLSQHRHAISRWVTWRSRAIAMIPMGMSIPARRNFATGSTMIAMESSMKGVRFPRQLQQLPQHQRPPQLPRRHLLRRRPEPDYLVGLGVDRTTVRQGDRLTYTITVRNFGPDTAINTIVNDLLSSGTTFHRAQANRGHFTAPPVGQTGTVTWYIGDLLNNGQESAQIAVTVIVRGETSITNTANVNSDTTDPNTANNTASIAVTVVRGGGGGGRGRGNGG